MRSSMDEEEDDVPTCPLCLEELDATDRAVKACQCGYQVCLWCLHTIRERLNGRCPACRTLYDEHNFKFDDFNAEQAAKEAKERKTAKKERVRREKLKEIERERTRALLLSQQKAKSNLKHARILQRNLVYVIGLSLTLAREEVIRRPDMFGRFGRIIRALVNRSHPFNADAPGGPSISAYVQYARDADALSAVRGMSNAVYDGREIRCAIATTKYCDALLRNAQVSDPAATYHCGNPQCMYYHSTSHSDSVLTREEALARQYGPPPPAHLFVTVSSRRPNFSPNNYRSAAAVPSTSQLTVQPANRPFTGRSSPSNANSLQSLASSPNNHNIPINSPTDTPVSNTPPISANMSSPKPIPPSSPPVPIRPTAASMSSSPRHSPPSSPPADHSASRRNRSPIPSDPPPAHASPNVSPPRSSLPLPSSATWAAQSNSSISRSPGRRSRPLAVPRRKAEAPPGFEDPTLARSPTTAPSRPPGFDSSPPNNGSENPMGTTSNDVSSKRVLLPASDSLSRNPHVSGSPPLIGRPPGFGHSPPTLCRPLDSTHGEAPTSWLQDDSSDAVYLFTQGRRLGRPIPEAVSRPSQGSVRDDKNQRSGLEQVLASIGGTLGVSSEIQHMQPPVSMHFKANGRHGTLHNTVSSIAESSIPTSHVFNPQPDTSFDSESRNEPNYSKPRVDSFPADLNRVVRTGEVPSSTLPSHTSVPANLSAFTPVNVNINIVRTAIALRGMRSHSRFRFAQDDSAEASNGDALDPRGFGVRFEGNGQQNGVTVDGSDHHHQRLHCQETKDYVDFIGSKKSNASTRQSKSRFDFADHGSSPLRDSGQVTDRVVDSSMYTTMGRISATLSSTGNQASMVKAAKAHPEAAPIQGVAARRSEVSDSYIEPSYPQHLAEEKPPPIFTATKWPPQSISHVPNYDGQVEMHQRDTRSMMAGTNVNMVDGLTSVTDVHGGNVVRRNVNNVLSIGNDRGIQATVEGLPPPGFRGATSGISPDTTAGDQTSANTGVATNVVPGGARSEAKVKQTSKTGPEKEESSVVQAVTRDFDKLNEDGKDSSIASGVTMDEMGVTNSSNSLGSGSVATTDSDDGRKRSHAQRKRDRKARQARETVGRERKVAKDSYNSNAGGGSSSSGSNSTRNTVTSTSNASSNTSISEELKTVNTSSAMTFETKGKNKDSGCKHRSVSDLEREVEEARAIEAQLLDELTKINRRLELYGKDNRVPI